MLTSASPSWRKRNLIAKVNAMWLFRTFFVTNQEGRHPDTHDKTPSRRDTASGDMFFDHTSLRVRQQI